METGIHSYLGSLGDINIISNHILNDYNILELPFIFIPRVTVFPGGTIPLRVSERIGQENIINYYKKGQIDFALLGDFKNKIGSIIRIQSITLNNNTEESFAFVGQCKKRFLLKTKIQDMESHYFLKEIKIQVLPNTETSNEKNIPRDIVPIKYKTNGFINLKSKYLYKQIPSMAYFDIRTYLMYDAMYLVVSIQKILLTVQKWKAFIGGMDNSLNNITESKGYIYQRLQNYQEPISFGYWLSATLPLAYEKQYKLLSENCLIKRLQFLKKIILEDDIVILCRDCKSQVANIQDSFVMTSDQAMSFDTFVNPCGIVAQLITFFRIKSNQIMIDLTPATMEDTWFPGYAWRPIYCFCFKIHLGWHFTASDTNLKPNNFFALKRDSVLMVNKNEKNEYPENLNVVNISTIYQEEEENQEDF